MISILVPTYNYNVFPLVKNLHHQCEDANLTFEILVLDDASKDENTITENSKINTFENVSYHVLTENIGRSGIRNLLANKAQFSKLLFLDADIMPPDNRFIQRYLPYLNTNEDVICGGVIYSEEQPPDNEMLRYIYGKNREVKSVNERNKDKFVIVSANILYSKTCFLKTNSNLDNSYGQDNIVSQNLKRENANVLHIDNPVIHLGLETSTAYLKKSLKALETLCNLEKKDQSFNNFTSLQQTHSKLKKYFALPLFNFGFTLIEPFVEKNLKSTKPSLLLFDLYRLNHYNKLKKNV